MTAGYGSLVLSAVSVAAFCQTIVKTPIRESTRITEASSPSGVVSLQLRNFSVNATYPKYGTEPGGVSVAYDPASRFYTWYFADDDPRDPPSYESPGALFRQLIRQLQDRRLVAYVLPDKMVTLELWLPRIHVKEWPNKAESLEDAVKKSMEEIRQRLLQCGGGRWPGYDLEKHTQLPDFGFNFYGPPLSPIDMPTTIARVSFEKGQWRIVLENQWRQEVVLDKNYSMLTTKRLQEAMAPHTFGTPE